MNDVVAGFLKFRESGRWFKFLRPVQVLQVALATMALGGCFSAPPRNPVPPSLVETAQVAGDERIRFWGDEMSQAFQDALTEQYRQVRAAAASGQAPTGDEKADFLVISGGGEDGAFAAGLLKGWTERGTRPVFEMVTGVSTGALAAPFVFLGSEYDDDLREIYTKYHSQDLYTSRGVFGLLGSSLDDTAPLKKLIQHFVTEEFLDRIGKQYSFGRRLFVATTNLDAERPMVWDLSAIAASSRPDRRDLFVDILLASSAVPGVFPPVNIPVLAADGHTYDELHVDGGVTAEMVFVPPQVNLFQYEEKAFGAGRMRALYVIRNGKLVPEYSPVNETALSLAKRAVETLVKYQVLSNLGLLDRFAGHDTQFHFVAIPPDFDAVAGSDFDPAYATKLYAAGRVIGLNGEWSTMTPAITPQLELK